MNARNGNGKNHAEGDDEGVTASISRSPPDMGMFNRNVGEDKRAGKDRGPNGYGDKKGKGKKKKDGSFGFDY